MTQLKTVIVDDEPLAIKLLKSKLSSIADIDVVAECANGREAIAAVLAHTPRFGISRYSNARHEWF